MAIIKCPECQKEISDTAKICPHCGVKAKKMIKRQARVALAKSLWKFIGIGFAILLLISVVSSLIPSPPGENNTKALPEKQNVMSANANLVGLGLTVDEFAKRYNKAAREYKNNEIYINNGQWERNNSYDDDTITWFLNGDNRIRATVFTDSQKIIKVEAKLYKNSMRSGSCIECVTGLIKAISPKMDQYGPDILASSLFEYVASNPHPQQANEGGVFYSVLNDNKKGIVDFSAINADDIPSK